LGFSYDSADRITQRTNSNDAYAWPATPIATYPITLTVNYGAITVTQLR